MYKIEKGKELIRKGHKYPFSEMVVGDSFLVDDGSNESARSNAYIYGIRNNMKFKTRKEKKTGYLRVHRVA